MADVYFEYAFPPRDASVNAARRAVFLRLLPNRYTKRFPSLETKADWNRAFLHVLVKWRQRAGELCEAGTPRFIGGQVQRARNCHPWGVAVKSYDGQHVWCHHVDICPWCAGRVTSEVFNLVERVFVPGLAVLTCLSTQFIPGDFSHAELQDALSLAKRLMVRLAMANADESVAAWWNVALEPPAFHKGHEEDFCLRSRLLMLLPREIPHILMPQGPGWSTTRDNEPSPEARELAAARVCAYPRGLFTGSIADTQRALEARVGLRLSEKSGKFRGLEPELVDDTFSAPRENSNSQLTEAS